MQSKLYTYVCSDHFQWSVNCCRNIRKLELTLQEKTLAFRTIYVSVLARILSDLLGFYLSFWNKDREGQLKSTACNSRFKIQLKSASVNIRGINKSLKRKATFRLLHTRKVSVAFLQETYSSKAQENIWSAEWGGKIYFNHGSKHSKGVAILFDPKLTVTVKQNYNLRDKNRRRNFCVSKYLRA